MKKKLDLNNPLTFNEKLQWLKINDHNPLYSKLADKYSMRQYIKNKIGDEYLFPLVGGPWSKFNDIDFEKLPDKFVLKCNHDSGSVVICNNKAKFNIKKAKKKINKSLKRNYYYHSREWPYKSIKPLIIAEKYMADKSNNTLTDYKFMCFHGEVKSIFTCTERFSKDGLKVSFFDLDWNMQSFERHYPKSKKKIPPPINLKQMINLSEKLSKGIPFIRVDLYEINKRIYFGEFTFYPGSGMEEFIPDYWDYTFGKWIDLKKLSKKK